MKKLIALLLAVSAVFSLSAAAYAAPPSDLITKENAQAIALEHAGYEAADVKFTKSKLDFDDGRYEYEIEFRADGNIEYEYTVNAENGKIVEYDRDYDAPDRIEVFSFFAWLKNLFARLFA